MTIMGKILVILNLVAALLVAGFLLFDFGTRTNWKLAAEKANEETTASRAHTAAEKAKASKLEAKIKKLTTDNETLKKDYDKALKDYKENVGSQTTLTKDQEAEVTKARAAAEAARQEALRLNEEVQMQRKGITEREQTITKLEDKLKTYLNRAVTAENSINSLKARLNSLLTQLEITSKKLVKAETGAGSGTMIKNPNAKNPPSVFVKGTVTGVIRDKNLVEVSIGSDQGVNENHTLEVYRLKPKPEYLGTIKILTADFHKAVGRVIKPEAGIRRSAIVKGDEVASKITTR